MSTSFAKSDSKSFCSSSKLLIVPKMGSNFVYSCFLFFFTQNQMAHLIIGLGDHSEENPNEDSVSASQRVSDDEQEDSYNETEDKIKQEEQHTGATQQLRVMTLSEQDHYPVVPITENVTNCLFDAFGGSLDISKEVQETEWGNRWTVSVNLQGKLCLVPGGNIAVNPLIF